MMGLSGQGDESSTTHASCIYFDPSFFDGPPLVEAVRIGSLDFVFRSVLRGCY
jgi:hypothetical protein